MGFLYSENHSFLLFKFTLMWLFPLVPFLFMASTLSSNTESLAALSFILLGLPSLISFFSSTANALSVLDDAYDFGYSGARSESWWITAVTLCIFAPLNVYNLITFKYSPVLICSSGFLVWLSMLSPSVTARLGCRIRKAMAKNRLVLQYGHSVVHALERLGSLPERRDDVFRMGSRKSGYPPPMELPAPPPGAPPFDLDFIKAAAVQWDLPLLMKLVESGHVLDPVPLFRMIVEERMTAPIFGYEIMDKHKDPTLPPEISYYVPDSCFSMLGYLIERMNPIERISCSKIFPDVIFDYLTKDVSKSGTLDAGRRIRAAAVSRAILILGIPAYEPFPHGDWLRLVPEMEASVIGASSALGRPSERKRI